MQPLDDLRLFHAVADTGSFTAAAEQFAIFERLLLKIGRRGKDLAHLKPSGGAHDHSRTTRESGLVDCSKSANVPERADANEMVACHRRNLKGDNRLPLFHGSCRLPSVRLGDTLFSACDLVQIFHTRGKSSGALWFDRPRKPKIAPDRAPPDCFTASPTCRLMMCKAPSKPFAKVAQVTWFPSHWVVQFPSLC